MYDTIRNKIDELLAGPFVEAFKAVDCRTPEYDSRPLSAVGVGDSFTVRRIPEELEFTPGLLEYLEASSLQPGHAGTLTAASPDGTMTVEIDGRHVGVGAFASARILVTA